MRACEEEVEGKEVCRGHKEKQDGEMMGMVGR